MDFNKFFQSKPFIIITWSIAGLVIILFFLKVGIAIGYKKAQFSYRWGENYHLNFGGPRGGFLFLADGRGETGFISSHGAVGQIIKIDGNSLIVKDRGEAEKTVLIGDNTTILRMNEEVKLADLKVDNFIVVIGDPNDAGQVEAKLIRIMPSPPPMDGSQKIFLKRKPI